MLLEKKIPKTFWPEALNWTVHVLNRSPTLVVKNKTPEEAWNGVKPSVEYFEFSDAFLVFICLIILDQNWIIKVCVVFCWESVRNLKLIDFMIHFHKGSL